MPPSNSLLSIPGNDSVIERLVSVIRRGSALAFAGAGASAGRYPLWLDLIEQLAATCVQAGLASETDAAFWRANAGGKPAQIAQAIKTCLGQHEFNREIRRIFSPRPDEDGALYTPAHFATASLNIRGIVTTNYDIGIVEARSAARPNHMVTGYATSVDHTALGGWLSGAIHEEVNCPILFAHGVFDRPETVVLDAEGYSALYRQGLYRRVFEKLWSQETLVFVGFSFNDFWLTYVIENVLSDVRNAASPRHFAIMGIDDAAPYTPEIRRLYDRMFGADIVLYRVPTVNGRPDHSGLLDVLHALPTVDRPTAPKPERPLETAPDSRGDYWAHETTNDEKYGGRSFELSRLDRWAADPAVRAVAITALGGQGKTALVGHWLKAGRSATDRRRPIFYWSLYAERDTKRLWAALLKFFDWRGRSDRGGASVERRRRAVRDVDEVIEALAATPTIIVLDGLEVLQEGPGAASYGSVLEDDLRDFLDLACRRKHAGLVVLTSRFPFADLSPYVGNSLRELQLDAVSPSDGARILELSDVGGTVQERSAVSTMFEGHPLALRIFAAILSAQRQGDPTRLCDIMFSGTALRPTDRLEAKLGRLLSFYQRTLSRAQAQILGVVSLFRSPIDERILLTIAEKQLVEANDGAGQQNSGTTASGTMQSLREAIGYLFAGGLLLRDHFDARPHYSCHPVLRDHFRAEVIRSSVDATSNAVAVLTARPSETNIVSIGEIAPILNAIEILNEAGFVEQAHELYHQRLADGEVFLKIPAVHEGHRCAMSFVADDHRVEIAKRRLHRREVFRYLNSAGFFSLTAGEPLDATAVYHRAAQVARGGADIDNYVIAKRSEAEALCVLGRLYDAERSGAAAKSGCDRFTNSAVVASCHATVGRTLGLLGQIPKALKAFERAEAASPDSGPTFIDGQWGLAKADILLRLGQFRDAGALAEAVLEASRTRQWANDVAIAEVLLSAVEVKARRHAQAEKRLGRVEQVLRRGHVFVVLPAVLLLRAELALGNGDCEDAARIVEEVIRLAAPRQMRLHQSDALVLLARVHLAMMSEASLYSALDHAESAQRLAHACGYAWGERDACTVLREALNQVGETKRATTTLKREQSLNRRLSRR